MSEYDDRMRRLLECEPPTSCEKWAIARIKELEGRILELTMERSKGQSEGLEIAVQFLDKHGFKEAAVRVQAMLDGAYI